MIFAVLGVVLLLALVLLPSWWVGRAMRAHAGERTDFPGTGAELARHLLDEAGLDDVKVERTEDRGDHYDPVARVVRLSDGNLAGRSITAVAIAAHEVAHAVQHARGDRHFDLRTKLVQALQPLQKVAIVVLFAAPVAAMFTHSPFLTIIQIVAALALLAVGVLVHLVTLPLELDASFNLALPALERGGYLAQADLGAAREVLRAAAYTYVAAALLTLVDVVRWIRVLV
jgi:Zn-dependent membrane protease YugP